jgi:hypothetical protein
MRGDLLTIYKIMNGIIQTIIGITFSTATTRGHDKKMFRPRCRTNIRKSFFLSRTIDRWNSLPQAATDSKCKQFQEPLDSKFENLRIRYSENV